MVTVVVTEGRFSAASSARSAPVRTVRAARTRSATAAEAARELDGRRRAWLNPPGASEEQLKRLTLTNLYNERPTWLANLHAALDRAVWAAYGWEDDPAGADGEAILSRLLALNGVRIATAGTS